MRMTDLPICSRASRRAWFFCTSSNLDTWIAMHLDRRNDRGVRKTADDILQLLEPLGLGLPSNAG
jgi:hypothetical protein